MRFANLFNSRINLDVIELFLLHDVLFKYFIILTIYCIYKKFEKFPGL